MPLVRKHYLGGSRRLRNKCCKGFTSSKIHHKNATFTPSIPTNAFDNLPVLVFFLFPFLSHSFYPHQLLSNLPSSALFHFSHQPFSLETYFQHLPWQLNQVHETLVSHAHFPSISWLTGLRRTKSCSTRIFRSSLDTARPLQKQSTRAASI